MNFFAQDMSLHTARYRREIAAGHCWQHKYTSLARIIFRQTIDTNQTTPYERTPTKPPWLFSSGATVARSRGNFMPWASTHLQVSNGPCPLTAVQYDEAYHWRPPQWYRHDIERLILVRGNRTLMVKRYDIIKIIKDVMPFAAVLILNMSNSMDRHDDDSADHRFNIVSLSLLTCAIHLFLRAPLRLMLKLLINSIDIFMAFLVDTRQHCLNEVRPAAKHAFQWVRHDYIHCIERHQFLCNYRDKK